MCVGGSVALIQSKYYCVLYSFKRSFIPFKQVLLSINKLTKPPDGGSTVATNDEDDTTDKQTQSDFFYISIKMKMITDLVTIKKSHLARVPWPWSRL